MKIARPIQDTIDSLSKLPGIGPKSAQRLAFYLLRVPQNQLDSFAKSLVNLKKETKMCSICKNITEEDPCVFCTNSERDYSKILVVEDVLDILVIEKSGKYKGRYHVLHGSINPLDNIGPDEIFLEDLFKRVKEDENIKEVIVATNPTLEGEATAMYINNKLKTIRHEVKVTRLGVGIPTGAYLEFTDELTISQSIDGRREL